MKKRITRTKKKKRRIRGKKKKEEEEVRNKKDETMADGSGRHGRDGTADAVAGGGDGGRREEMLPEAKKYFQPLAFNY